MAEQFATVAATEHSLHSLQCLMIWREDRMSDMVEAVTPRVRALLPAARTEAEAVLRPAPVDTLAKGLSSCLSLVVPTGMDQDERRTWLIVASKTLEGVPQDLLERGVRQARLAADHPSKIIPAIMKEIGAEWQRRKGRLARVGAIEEAARRAPALPAPGQEVATPEEVRAILAKHCPWAATNREEGAPSITPAKTYDDYITMGMSPDEARICVEQAEREGRYDRRAA